jgi:hypothetical protein
MHQYSALRIAQQVAARLNDLIQQMHDPVTDANTRFRAGKIRGDNQPAL